MGVQHFLPDIFGCLLYLVLNILLVKKCPNLHKYLYAFDVFNTSIYEYTDDNDVIFQLIDEWD